MKSKNKLIVTTLLFGLCLGFFSSQLFAQNNALIADKGGKFHVGSAVLAGTTLLKSGMYKVQHVIEGNDHVIIFRVIRMNRYKNAMGNERLGEEVARVKCTTEPAGKEWKNTKLILDRNAPGQRVVKAVQISGENVLHKI
jgi:hypothetical protein